MPVHVRDTSASKRATNLSVDSALLDEAKALQINLSATLERALMDEVRARKRERWLAENRDGIATYNEHIRDHGTFGEGVRRF